MEMLRWNWTPTMALGSGCKVHLRDGVLPMGRNAVSVSKHMVAVFDGVIQDTHATADFDSRFAFRDIVFRSPTFPFPGRRTEEYGLSDRQSTGASDRAVDSRVVLVRTNDRLQHFWRRTC
jgi:hypothetical protein